LGAAISVACSGQGDQGPECEVELGAAALPLSVPNRALVGGAASYTPDLALSAAADELRHDQHLRRAAAWEVVRRFVEPLPIVGQVAPGLGQVALPRFQGWYGHDDLTRVFRRLYSDLSPGQRSVAARFSGAEQANAFALNDGPVDDAGRWGAGRLMAYGLAIDQPTEVAGLGGIQRVGYSPAASQHLLESYAEVLGCNERGLPVEGQDARDVDRCAGGEGKPFPCVAGAFPPAAAIAKASFRRADFGIALPVFDTSGPALAERLAHGGDASWGDADAEAWPEPGEIYTQALPTGATFSLAGLHMMTRELDHWLWISLWWSPDPDSDFGEDRPASFPAPWHNYKMCTVVAFTESDPDPSGGLSETHPSLARALEATYAGVGGPSWCSNPYLERGDGNAATNCVGCHQHAGSGLSPELLVGDAQRFPRHGRTQLRSTFPTDYVYGAERRGEIGAVFHETAAHFAP
jgi:hypothetical protein